MESPRRWNLSERVVQQPIRYWHKLLVPTAFARLVSPDQQNCSAARVKGKQYPVRPSPVLNPQFMLACRP